MTNFKEGDTVVLNEKYMDLPEGAGGTITDTAPDLYDTDLVKVAFEGDRVRSVYSGRLRLAADEPKWSDVEAGDAVTFEDLPSGEKVKVKATSRGGGVLVLGAYTDSMLTQDTRRLISIEKPKPVPPQTPGSVIMILHPEGHEKGNRPVDSFPMFRLRFPAPGPDGVDREWISDRGTYWSDESVRNGYGGAGFRVLHDAGKE